MNARAWIARLSWIAYGATLALAQRAAAIGAACVDCHAAHVESYRASPMARALEPVRPGELTGLAVVEAADGAGAWRLSEAHGEPTLAWTSKAGVAQPAMRRPVLFAIGAGVRDRSYVELRAGTNAAAPGYMHFAAVEVVTALRGGDRTTALAPWASIEPAADIGPAVTPECLACHTSSLPPSSFPLNLRPAESVWQPRGIDCSACHVGAEPHADWRRAELLGTPPAERDPLSSHARLDRLARVAACAGCHLQGDARIELVPGVFAPPPPGVDLLSRRAVYVAATPSDDVGFVSHVERFVLSRCYTAGTRTTGASCESCHDPHRAIDAPGERRRVRDACAACHESAACPVSTDRRGASDCVDCHMRSTRVFDVADVEIHDHWIRARPGPPSVASALRVAESRDGRLRRFDWNLADVPVPSSDSTLDMLAYARLDALASARTQAFERAAAELTGPSRELGMAHHVRAELLAHAGKLDEARKAYKRALLVEPGLEASRINLALLLGELGRADEGRVLLDAVLERHPYAEGALRNRAVLKRALADPRGALADLRASFELFPRASVAQAIADLAGALGDIETARQWASDAATARAQR